MSASDEQFLSVPEERLDAGGWVRTDETIEPVFELPGTSVEGATLVYGDVRASEGERAKVTQFRAELPLNGGNTTLPITGWVDVWHADGFRIGAGAYPERAIGDILGIEDPPEILAKTSDEYRDELLGLVRAIR